jgi:hypothetical protein
MAISFEEAQAEIGQSEIPPPKTPVQKAAKLTPLELTFEEVQSPPKPGLGSYLFEVPKAFARGSALTAGHLVGTILQAGGELIDYARTGIEYHEAIKKGGAAAKREIHHTEAADFAYQNFVKPWEERAEALVPTEGATDKENFIRGSLACR